MELGMIGLGRMGGSMSQRLIQAGHSVTGYARSQEAIKQLIEKGVIPAASLRDLVSKLKAPRIIWLMIPAGDPVDETLVALLPLLTHGDVVIDGGNSNYKDTQRRAHALRERGLHYVDAGTSGGVWGLQNGYSIMVGGEADVVDR